jgi:hypothetical protein
MDVKTSQERKHISGARALRTEITKFGSSHGVDVHSSISDNTSIGGQAHAHLGASIAASGSSGAGKARIVTENSVGERRASQLKATSRVRSIKPERTGLNVLIYQLAGSGCIAEASLPGGAGEAVATINAGRGNGGEGMGCAAKQREHAHEKRVGLHCSNKH